jgi:hypothetical protein
VQRAACAEGRFAAGGSAEGAWHNQSGAAGPPSNARPTRRRRAVGKGRRAEGSLRRGPLRGRRLRRRRWHKSIRRSRPAEQSEAHAPRRAVGREAASGGRLRRRPLRGRRLRRRRWHKSIRRSRPAEQGEAHAPKARRRPMAAVRKAAAAAPGRTRFSGLGAGRASVCGSRRRGSPPRAAATTGRWSAHRQTPAPSSAIPPPP